MTTSRNPTQQIRTFCKDLANMIPNTLRFNRGKSSLTTLAEKALEHQAQKIIIADRWKGGLGKIQLFTMGETDLEEYRPLIYVKSMKLRREFKHAPTRAVKHLTIQTEPRIPLEAQKLADALANFLNIQHLAEEPFQSNTQTTMHISLNPSHRIQITFLQIPRKIEIGPRITVSHLIWSQPK